MLMLRLLVTATADVFVARHALLRPLWVNHVCR